MSMCRNSLKQMLRTPVKTILFLALITASAILVVLGTNLFFLNHRDMEKFEKMFTTIGVAEQISKESELIGSWDAELDTEYYYSKSGYGEWIDPSVLEFQGADYLVKPEKMPWFVAYMPEIESPYLTEGFEDQSFLVEVTPLETGEMAPLPVKVTKVLGENQKLLGKTIWVCDHNNPKPDILDAGETYVMYIQGPGTGHDKNGRYLNAEQGEYYLSKQQSTQYNSKGKCIGESAEEHLFDEVTTGFYETDRGKYWIELAKTSGMWKNLYPVYPVKSLDFILPFQEKTAYLTDGREITKKEYEKGKDVCILPEDLAVKNNLKVGNKIELPLIGADYKEGPNQTFRHNGGSGFDFTLMNAEWEIYEPFDTNEYEIVGLYRMEKADDSDMGISGREIIIPYTSVTNSWENNILQDGPMNAGTTRFQIPNGTIDSFLKQWNEQGIKDVEITFYDGGYSELQDSIQNRKFMAYVLLIGGSVTAMLIMLLFGHLFISKQEQRTAIERSLGMSRRQCMSSMLSGIAALLCVGVILGSTGGWKLTEYAATQTSKAEKFDTTYTAGKGNMLKGQTASQEMEKGTEGEMVLTYDTKDTIASTVIGGGVLLLSSFGIVSIYMRQNLKKEPIRLLTGSEE